MLQAGRSRVRFRMMSLDFAIDVIVPAVLWLRGRLSLWQKWVPEIFLGGKGPLALKDHNLTAIYEPIVWKMLELRRLTTHMPPRPITGITLPLPFTRSFLTILIVGLILFIGTWHLSWGGRQMWLLWVAVSGQLQKQKAVTTLVFSTPSVRMLKCFSPFLLACEYMAYGRWQWS
jgi:hypothetical protein